MGPLFVIWFWLIVAIGPFAAMMSLKFIGTKVSDAKKVLIALAVYGVVILLPVFLLLIVEIIKYIVNA